MAAMMFGPREGQRVEARGSEMYFKAVAATTNGRFSLMERSLPPGGRIPPPHIHLEMDEAYYVLDGEVTFAIDRNEVRRGPDTFVLVPSGTSHTFGNSSDRPSQLIVLHVPSLDRYFEELDELWSGAEPPSRDDEFALMRRHGIERWATVSRRSASMQTIVKTKVVYDWLPRVAHMRDGP